MFADYKSKDGDIITYRKPYGEDFPKFIEKNGKIYHRIFGIPVMHVAEGLTGNAANGYESSVDGVYRPSPYTPLDKVYGNAGRQAGVEAHEGD